MGSGYTMGKCFICGKRAYVRDMFATVNPVTGKGGKDEFVNPKTGNLNSPWPAHGRWVSVCRQCIVDGKGIGLKEHRPFVKLGR